MARRDRWDAVSCLASFLSKTHTLCKHCDGRQNFCTDVLFPEWCMWEQFTIDSQSAALNLDALRSSHPIQVRKDRQEAAASAV